MISVYFSICCFIFLSIITFFYFSKSRLKNIDNRIFSILIITNLVGTFIDVGGFVSFQTFSLDSLINQLIAKVYLVYYLFYTFTLLIYVYNLTFNNLKQILKNVSLFLVGVIFIIFILKIDVHPSYTGGPAVNFTYFFGFLFLLIMIYCLIKNKRKIFSKTFIPLFAYVLLTFITVLIQKINPQLTILLLCNTIVTFLMYFTIENPDLKILEEMTKIKILTEKTYDDKSTFIYQINDEVNMILNNMKDKISGINEKLEVDNIDGCKNDLKNVVTLIDNSKKRFNSIIDISELDSKELKNVNNKYNVINLLNQIITYNKDKVKKNVEFRSSISNSLPSMLYGDSIKVKQIINCLIDNSIKNTYKGFIELRVSCIIKYDVCRMIITVEDSGTGIDLIKQNEILSDKSELSDEDIKNKDNSILNLKTVKKMINMIGGTLSIESLNSNGTTINVTLDQKVVDSDIGYMDKDLNNYKIIIATKRKVGVITENDKNVKVIKQIGKKNNYKVESFDMTKTCLDKIRDGEAFDIIVIDEDMDKIDARSFLDKVRKVDSFKGKVFVITKKNGIQLKKELKDYGFDAILIEPLNKKDVEVNFK